MSVCEDDDRVISDFKECDTKDWLSVQFEFGLFQVSQKKTSKCQLLQIFPCETRDSFKVVQKASYV